VEENFTAMERFLKMQALTQYRTTTSETGEPVWQYADWLSFEDYEPCNGSAYENFEGKRLVKPMAVRYWNFLSGCYWHQNAVMMSEMAQALGKNDQAEKYRFMSKMAMRYIRADYVDPESGMLIKPFRHLQGAALFALKCKVLENPQAIEKTKRELTENIAARGGCLSTGFLGTSIILDTLSENGMSELAYSLLLSRKFPGWLYSVEQGATTVWERWNSYTKKDGFGPVGMNSFNHYAYGCILGWMYRNIAGIAADAENPGFKTIIMAPKTDRRLGFVRASYKSAAGLIKSEWRYEGTKWIWRFTIPEGTTAKVTIPGEEGFKIYKPGSYRIER
jgi:alpha-L-rhamnosidase